MRFTTLKQKLVAILTSAALLSGWGYYCLEAYAQSSQITASTCNQTNPTITSASTKLLDANGARKLGIVQNNDSTLNLFMNFGASTASVTTGIKLTPGQNIYMGNPISVLQWNANTSASSTTSVVVMECF